MSRSTPSTFAGKSNGGQASARRDASPAPAASSPPASSPSTLEDRISVVGERLATSIAAVLDLLPDKPQGPVELARTLGVDKVLASRVLKAARNHDPMAVTHVIPGPDPLRRLLRAAGKRGVDAATIRAAGEAVDQFEQLIRHEAGDRSALDAIISAWLPEARQQFEIRRKQSAFKAMSQIKGACANTNISTAILHPSADGVHLDIVWILGLQGLQRLRPGAAVKFASRRMILDGSPRRPTTLSGRPVEGIEGLRLDAFCSQPPAKLDVHHHGEVVHYTLAGDAFGPNSATDLVFAEANFNEMDRFVPARSNRKGYVFADISTPVKQLLFDVFLHDDVYPDSEPSLHVYDTVVDGVASVNDPSRDIDRFDMLESIHALGRGTSRFRASDVPNYFDMVRDVIRQVGWDGEQFRGYRSRIEYPIYGSQVAIAFDPPVR